MPASVVRQAVAPEPSLSEVVVLDTDGRPVRMEARVTINADGADDVAFVAEALLFGEHTGRPELCYTNTGTFWLTAVGLRHSTSRMEGVVVGIDFQRRMLQLALDEENGIYCEIMARAVTVLDEEPVRVHGLRLPHSASTPASIECFTATLADPADRPHALVLDVRAGRGCRACRSVPHRAGGRG